MQEIGQALDTPDDVVFDDLQRAAFPDQALGRAVLGTAERVSSFDRNALKTYMSDHYRAPRMVLSAAGNIDHQAIVRQATEAFSGLPGSDQDDVCPPAVYAGGDQRRSKALEQAHVLLGFKGIAYNDPDYYALHVASTVFGGGMSSRLFQEVRETKGLAYSIYCYGSSYRDGGLFGIYAGTAGEKVNELTAVVASEAAKLCDKAEEAEVVRARAQLKAGILMSLESSSSRCEQIAKQMLIYDRVVPAAELIEAIDNVDTSAVESVMGRIIGSGELAVAAIGPIEQLESYDRLSARFGS